MKKGYKKIIILLIFIVFQTITNALELEQPTIKGANFTVRGVNGAKSSAFTKEPTIASITFLFTNKRWRYDTFSYQTQAYNPLKLPKELLGLCFYQLPLGGDFVYDFHSDGEIYALVSNNTPPEKMQSMGFTKVEKMKPFRFRGMPNTESAVLYKRDVKKGFALKSIQPWMIVAGLTRPQSNRNGETLYNGIIIPRQWPPDYKTGDIFDPFGIEPMPVPYLTKKPALINISVGRQLFVDDFLIAKGDFEREFHMPKKYEGNPIFKPETELEKGKPVPLDLRNAGITKTAPCAAPASGGLWYNSDKGVFELYYNASWHGTLAYAYSKDLVNWTRPNLGIYGDTNQVFPDDAFVDSGAVFYDSYEANPAKKYKNFNVGGVNARHGRLWYSDDGVNFDYPKYFSAGISGERSTMFYNPFRKKWVFSLRWHSNNARRTYVESDDFIEGSDWIANEPVYWVRHDKNDVQVSEKSNSRPTLYNFDAIAYESLIVGFYEIWYGPDNFTCQRNGHPKLTGIKFGYSRDGFHFSRPDYRLAIKWGGDDDWDRGYVQCINGGITVHGDEMRIWYIGAKGFGGPWPKDKPQTIPSMLASTGMHGNLSLGYATLRRDGFASINSKADGTPAEILTEPVQFVGSYLFANIDAPQGALYAQVEDMNGKVIEPYSFDNCIPAKGDSTHSRIKWKGSDDLSSIAYKPVRFRFKMKDGKFYSFWVSVAKNGRSDGYLGAGSPNSPTPLDTAGIKKHKIK